MIVYGERHKVYEPVFKDCPPRRAQSLSEALTTLLVYELGFGGKVIEVKEEGDMVQVTTRTQVLACTDYMFFSGTKAEMEPFCRVVAAWAEFMRARGGTLVESVAERMAGRNTFEIVHVGPLLFGSGASFAALMIAYDIPVGTIPELKKYELKDVIAAVCLDPKDPLALLA